MYVKQNSEWLHHTVRKVDALRLLIHHGNWKRLTANPSRTSKINGPATCHDPLMRNMPEVNVQVVAAVDAQLGVEPTLRGLLWRSTQLRGITESLFPKRLINYKLENVGDKLNSEQCSSVMVHEFCVGIVPAVGADLEAPRKYRGCYLIKIRKPARRCSGNVMRTIPASTLSNIKQYDNWRFQDIPLFLQTDVSSRKWSPPST